jgi:hypothetical protein
MYPVDITSKKNLHDFFVNSRGFVVSLDSSLSRNRKADGTDGASTV